MESKAYLKVLKETPKDIVDKVKKDIESLSCEHQWMNSGVRLQGKSLKMCLKCGITN